jgi:hypothetical protein
VVLAVLADWSGFAFSSLCTQDLGLFDYMKALRVFRFALALENDFVFAVSAVYVASFLADNSKASLV